MLATGATAIAGDYAPRQYYGQFYRHPKHNYSYRSYYYKPSPAYSGYRHHVAVYVPAKPKHVYFYTPTKSSTGAAARSTTVANRNTRYSLKATAAAT